MTSTSNVFCLSIFLFLMLCFVFSAYAQQASSKAKLTPIVVTEVKRDVFHDKIEGLGTLRANETVTLMSTVTETITAVNFEDGQNVEIGTILVEMTNNQEKAQLEQVRIAVDEAKKQLNRLELLVKSNAAPQALLDEQSRDYNSAKARLSEIQSQLSDHLILAPFSGRLGMRNISVGTMVRPGDAITTLDDNSQMKLDFTVPSIYLASLKSGLPINAKAREFGEKIFSGTIMSVANQIDPVSRSIMVRAILPNDGLTLRPGLLMNVEIIANERQAIIVPEKATILEGNKNFVFLLDETQSPAIVKRIEVEIGARRAGEIEIVSGLSVGDKVVTHGTINIRDGGAVSVMTTESGQDSLNSILDNSMQGNTKR